MEEVVGAHLGTCRRRIVTRRGRRLRFVVGRAALLYLALGFGERSLGRFALGRQGRLPLANARDVLADPPDLSCELVQLGEHGSCLLVGELELVEELDRPLVRRRQADPASTAA
jgi:hypothetical protein